MGIKLELSESEFQILGLGFYEARIQEIEYVEGGQFGNQLKWKLETLKSEVDINGDVVPPGLSLWGWSSVSYSPYPSKAFKWTAAILGDSFDPLANFDSELLEGRAVRVEVGEVEYEKDGAKKVKNKVISLRASREFDGFVSLPADDAQAEGDSIPF